MRTAAAMLVLAISAVAVDTLEVAASWALDSSASDRAGRRSRIHSERQD